MKKQKYRFFFAVFVVLAAFACSFLACEQPNKTKARESGPGPLSEEEDVTLNNEVSAIKDDKGKLKNVVAISSAFPKEYRMTGNKNASFLVIEPGLNSPTVSAEVTVDGVLWGTFTGAGDWIWPEAPPEAPPEEPGMDPSGEGGNGENTGDNTGSSEDDGSGGNSGDNNGDPEEETDVGELNASENGGQKTIPFDVVTTIVIKTKGENSPTQREYIYTIYPASDYEQPGAAKARGIVSGRVAGNFSQIFQASNYRVIKNKNGYVLRAVEALAEDGTTIVGSTTWDAGELYGRFFKMQIMSVSELDLANVKYRAVFQRSGSAHHYSYPAVHLKNFAAKADEATTETPYEHKIMPEEINYNSGNMAWSSSWMVNGPDFAVPAKGKIKKVIIEGTSTTNGLVSIALFRGVALGKTAIRIYETPVNTVSGTNEIAVDWDVAMGDRVGAKISQETNWVKVSVNTNNGTGFLVTPAGVVSEASNFSAVGLGFVFEPKEDEQFGEFPVTFAAIHIGGDDSYKGMGAKDILTQLGQPGSVFPLDGTYMLHEDVNLSNHTWVSIGRRGRNDVFSGWFMGNGHTIKNVKFDLGAAVTHRIAGFFGFVSGTSVDPVKIHDLNIVVDTSAALTYSTTAGATSGYFGVIAGAAYSPEFINLHVRSNDPAKPLEIRNNVVDTVNFAGILGHVNEGYMMIKNCSNSLDFNVVSASANTRTAGILASNSSNSTNIRECYNDGVLTTRYTGTNTGAYIMTGGIGGKWDGTVVTRNSYSTGKITAIYGSYQADNTTLNWDGHGKSRIGGLFGEPYKDGANKAQSCYAAGSLYQKGRTDDDRYMGGIVGFTEHTYGCGISGNMAIMPSITWETPASSGYAVRIARTANGPKNNFAYKYMIGKQINHETGEKFGSFENNSTMHGTDMPGTEDGHVYTIKEIYKFTRQNPGNWAFEDTRYRPGGSMPSDDDREWYWKMADVGPANTDILLNMVNISTITNGDTKREYPFPLLWWQATKIGDATGGGSWWETRLPAIKETWKDDTGASVFELDIPHEFPED
jgi:hypothetical protein